MAEDGSKDRHKGKLLTVRFDEDELARLERLRERLQARAASGVRVTQRMTILTALERLEAHLAKLERDQERKR